MNYVSEQYINQNNKMNAPTFAYYTLYNKLPSPPISGREISHQSKLIKNIPLDSNIPEDAFLKIYNIRNIETRSSCEGQDKRHPTFLIIRLLNKSTESTELFVNTINKMKNIKSSFNIGMAGLPRICITWYTWFEHKDYYKWWNDLPYKINKSI